MDERLRFVARLLEGADVVTGGEADVSDRYIAPTILKNVREEDAVMQEEIFGPILPVISVPSIDSATQTTTRTQRSCRCRPRPYVPLWAGCVSWLFVADDDAVVYHHLYVGEGVHVVEWVPGDNEDVGDLAHGDGTLPHVAQALALDRIGSLMGGVDGDERLARAPQPQASVGQHLLDRVGQRRRETIADVRCQRVSQPLGDPGDLSPCL